MLFPGFNIPTLNFGQFWQVKMIWDIGGISTGQSTLYYAQDDMLPFIELPSWADDFAQSFLYSIWAYDPLNPLKPALSKVVSNQVKLQSILVNAYNDTFDLITPQPAEITINQPGLAAGDFEDSRFCMNVRFNLGAEGIAQAGIPKKTYVALPPPVGAWTDRSGRFTNSAISSLAPDLAALAKNIHLAPFGSIYAKPIRVKQGTALIEDDYFVTYGYAPVRSVSLRPIQGVRRSRLD